MNFQKLAETRYSCRKMSAQPVDRKMLDRIIEAGIKAPTAVNKQPVKIFIMDSPKAKAAVKQVTNHCFGAETFLVVGCRKEDAWVREYDGRNFGDVDAAIVATHMMLEITDLGLATTWVGHFDAPKLKKLCPLLADYDLIALFPVGYAAEDAEPSARHSQRKSVEEMTAII